MIIDNAETRFDKVFQAIDGTVASISDAVRALSGLLTVQRANFVSEYKHESDFYEQMYKTFTYAVVLLNTVNNVKCLQNLQNLYSDDNEEKTINNTISSAIDEVRAFFDIMGALPKSEYTDEESYIYTINTSIEEYKKKSEKFNYFLRELREYAQNHEKNCAARRNLDIAKLGRLTDRIEPAVPETANGAVELIFNGKTYATKTATAELGDAAATLAISDIVQAYSTEKGKSILASSPPLLSLEALGRLGLISDGAGLVWVLDDGYPVTDEIKTLFNTKLLIDEKQSVCFSSSAFNKLFEKK